MQGLDDGSVQSQFRLADAAVVDLMLRTIDTQLTIAKPLIRLWLSEANVVMDAPLTRKATQLAVLRCSVFRPFTPVIHNLRDARVENADWMQMRKWNTLHNKAFVMNGCALNARLMMPSEDLQYMTECV